MNDMNANTTPRERPILFSGEMVRAILSNRKTQTRRAGKCQNDSATGLGVAYVKHATKGYEAIASYDAFPGQGTARWGLCSCPYGIPGDRLWVKETFAVDRRVDPKTCGVGYVHYVADEWGCPRTACDKLKPSIFMPRKFSRITLEIVSVRVERLQNISEEDAKAEGIESSIPSSGCGLLFKDYEQKTNDVFEWYSSPVDSYRSLWESINGKGSWATNPWLWVLEFKKL